ncbi:MAG: alkaline phosphatase family protein [Anaerolineae bacterium]|nr:alkaline phosphatase family protein [Anaerolineae bacterium]
MNRILVVGIDGGTFDLIRPWAEAGHLPHLARLMDEGAWGLLESTLPPVTSPAWPTFATGKNPGQHGVFDFIQPAGGEFDLVNSTSIQSPTLWQILSNAGRQVGVINVPVTYPPAAVNGFIVGGMLSPRAGRITYPDHLLDPYRDELGPYRVAPAVQHKEGNEDEFIADLLDLVAQRGKYGLRMMADHRWDFYMVHFQATDVLQHALWKHIDPAHPLYDPQAAARFAPMVRQVFERVDDFVGRLVEQAGEDTSVIVMSDHGFGALHWVVNLNLFLLQAGLLQLKRDPFTRLRAGLFRAGLTPASVWHWIERAGLQNYVWLVSKSTRNKVVSKFLSFDDVDWSRTQAYSMGHVGQIYVNLKGREPQGIVEPGTAYQAVRQRAIEVLRELRHPETGQPMVDQVIPGDQVAHGPYAQRGPDLHVVLDGYRAIAFPLFATDSRLVTRQIRGDSGCHRRHGILIACGPAFRGGQTLQGARIVDLAPTILHVMGLPVPDDMDGRVLTSILATDRPVAYEQASPAEASADSALSAEDLAEVEERLRALGYLG